MTLERIARRYGADLEKMMARHLGLRRGALQRRAKRAGRRLPSPVQADISLIAQAPYLLRHPKLRHRVDQAALDASYRRARGALQRIDRGYELRGWWLSWAGSLVVGLMLLGAGLLAVLAARGAL